MTGAVRTRTRLALGTALLAVWAWHAAGHVLAGNPGDALWCCVVGEVLAAVGLLAARPGLAAVGALWLAYGVPLFVLTVAAGEPMSLASWVTHVFGPAAALGGVGLLGYPRGSWWRAALALLGLRVLCRLVTPSELNVNLVFAVYGGWEELFPSLAVYQVVLAASALATFGLFELGLRRLAPSAPVAPPSDEPSEPAAAVEPAAAPAPSGARG